jgi:transposase
MKVALAQIDTVVGDVWGNVEKAADALAQAVEGGAELVAFPELTTTGGITTRFLNWCSENLEAIGKKVLILVWDNASWHISHEVRNWIDEHNREAKKSRRGVRIPSCLLPKQSPWLNSIEPKWIHGKRRVMEADRSLTAHELVERVCDAFECPHYEPLSIPEKVA